MLRGLLICTVAICFASLSAQAQAPSASAQVPHIYLIQNSGWMLAYYVDRNARFREFIQELVATTAPPGGRVVIADFNTENQVRDRQSPRVLASGTYTPELVQSAIAKMDREPPRKTGEPNALVDADYAQAIDNTFRRPDLANQAPAVIWMVTNNKYAPDTTGGRLDSGIANLTARFNDALNRDQNIVRLLALIKQIPAAKPVERGVEFEGRGLVVYALAYGEPADAPLQLAAERLEQSSVFDTRPARLKPLAIAPLNFVAQRIQTPGIDFNYDAQGRLVLRNVPANTPVTVQIEGTLSSNYYPQVIDSAAVQMAFESKEGIEKIRTFGALLSRDKIERLRPGEKLEEVILTLQLPAIVRDSPLQTEEQINGTVRLSIGDVRLELSEDFDTRMKVIFAADRWRAVFLDSFQVTRAATELPILIIVPFSLVPFFASLIGLLALAAIALWLLWLAMREKRAIVAVEGEQKTAFVKPWRTVVLRARNGQPAVAVTGSLIGAPKVRYIPLAQAEQGASAKLRASTRVPRR